MSGMGTLNINGPQGAQAACPLPTSRHCCNLITNWSHMPT